MRFVHCEVGDPEARPFVIFAALMHRTLGDFIEQLVFAASVKEMFSHARLNVYFKPDRPYKADVVRLSPQVDSVWPTEKHLPMELFDTAGDKPLVGPEAWYEQGCDAPDLVLTPSNCLQRSLGSFSRRAVFQVPDPENWDSRLRELVRPGWYCVMHYREAGYGFRDARGENRDVPAEYAEPVIDAIIAKGGQVVRIGHPEMTRLRARNGYIDLSAAPFFLQAQAVNRSRFFLELSPSGPASLATAFDVPRLRCNSLNLEGPVDHESIVMPIRVSDDDGKDVTETLIRENRMNDITFRDNTDFTLKKCRLSDILFCVDELLETTKSVTSWRDMKNHQAPFNAPNRLGWPVPPAINFRVAV